MSLLDFVLALLIVIALSLAPLLAWRQTRRVSFFVFLGFVGFMAIVEPFVFCRSGPTVDSLWSYQAWATLIRQWVNEGILPGWNPYIGGGQPFALYNNVLPATVPLAFSALFKLLHLSLDQNAFFNLICN